MRTDTDVVVVGAGLSGLVAATELVDAGRRVVVLDQESEASLGGQTYWSFGGLFLADTPEQRRLGIHDSHDLTLQGERKPGRSAAPLFPDFSRELRSSLSPLHSVTLTEDPGVPSHAIAAIPHPDVDDRGGRRGLAICRLARSLVPCTADCFPPRHLT